MRQAREAAVANRRELERRLTRELLNAHGKAAELRVRREARVHGVTL